MQSVFYNLGFSDFAFSSFSYHFENFQRLFSELRLHMPLSGSLTACSKVNLCMSLSFQLSQGLWHVLQERDSLWMVSIRRYKMRWWTMPIQFPMPMQDILGSKEETSILLLRPAKYSSLLLANWKWTAVLFLAEHFYRNKLWYWHSILPRIWIGRTRLIWRRAPTVTWYCLGLEVE